MEFQHAFNVAVAVIGGLAGWIMRVMWDGLTDLRKADRELAEKVGSIEVVVAGQYVKRDELDRSLNALFSKLDRIEDKLDGKQDK